MPLLAIEKSGLFPRDWLKISTNSIKYDFWLDPHHCNDYLTLPCLFLLWSSLLFIVTDVRI